MHFLTGTEVESSRSSVGRFGFPKASSSSCRWQASLCVSHGLFSEHMHLLVSSSSNKNTSSIKLCSTCDLIYLLLPLYVPASNYCHRGVLGLTNESEGNAVQSTTGISFKLCLIDTLIIVQIQIPRLKSRHIETKFSVWSLGIWNINNKKCNYFTQ